jgi:hypothetical protein
MPVSLLTSDIYQFQNILTFASKLLEREKSIENEFTRDSLFTEYLKDITKAHSEEIVQLEKRILSESTARIAPLVNRLTESERASSEKMEETCKAYEQQLKQLRKRNADLEFEVQVSSRSDTSIREQCRAESDRLIHALDEKNKEILCIKEEEIRKREEILIQRENELQVKIHRQASPAFRGKDGEQYFSDLAKDKMNWDLLYTGDIPHSCDYSSKIQNIPAFFEIKHYTHSVPNKEVVKFLRDMKEHPDIPIGIFISLNTPIQGKLPSVPISFDWINDTQCALYIQTFNELDSDQALSIIDQMVRLAGKFSKCVLSKDDGAHSSDYERRIDQAKAHVTASILRAGNLTKRLANDRKQCIQMIETSMNTTILEMKQQVSELHMVVQVLLGEYSEPLPEETEEAQATVVATKPKKKTKTTAHS